jgi:hypothetical protein
MLWCARPFVFLSTSFVRTFGMLDPLSLVENFRALTWFSWTGMQYTCILMKRGKSGPSFSDLKSITIKA